MTNTLTISSSIEITNSIAVETPVYGQERIHEGSKKRGVQRRTYVLAIDACDGEGSNVSAGADCLIFGDEMTGDCVIASKQTSIIGGTSSRPYTQETISVIGLSNG